MQAIVNNNVVNVSERLMGVMFFTGWRELLETRVTWRESDVKLDEVSTETIGNMLEFDTEFFTELMLMNNPVEGLRNAFSALNCEQTVRLIEAADYFGDEEALNCATRRLSTVCYIATDEQLLQYYHIVANSHTKPLIWPSYMSSAYLRIQGLSLYKLVSSVAAIDELEDQELLDLVYSTICEILEPAATASIEFSIDEFVKSHEHLPFAGVDWRALRWCSLSNGFKHKFGDHMRAQQYFLNHNPQYIVDAIYNNTPLLSLENLPVVTKTFELLHDVIHVHTMKPTYLHNMQWNENGIDYENYGNHMQERIFSRITMEDYVHMYEGMGVDPAEIIDEVNGDVRLLALGREADAMQRAQYLGENLELVSRRHMTVIHVHAIAAADPDPEFDIDDDPEFDIDDDPEFDIDDGPESDVDEELALALAISNADHVPAIAAAEPELTGAALYQHTRANLNKTNRNLNR